MTKYIYMEAVNLAHFVDDTSNISIIRGGGIGLLEAPNSVLAAHGWLEKVYIGASQAMFRVKDDNSQTAAEAAQSIRQWLAADALYKHATFVFGHGDYQADDADALPNLRRQAHRQQMQSPNFVFHAGAAGAEICGFDRVRPSDGGDKVDGNYACAACRARHGTGRTVRNRFYTRVLKQPVDDNQGYQFTSNLEELTGDTGDSIPEAIRNKIAVFYADGNKFSNLRGTSAGSVASFAADLEAKRRTMALAMLQWFASQPNATLGKKLRFETLLWGGDEILLVVPAWMGFALAQQFFVLTKDWTYGGTPMTHAAGLVIANHKAPIRQLRDLAKHIADEAKQTGNPTNGLAYQVLESFDTLGSSADRVRSSYKPLSSDSLVLDTGQIENLPAWKTAMKKAEFPRSQHITLLRKGLRASGAARNGYFHDLRDVWAEPKAKGSPPRGPWDLVPKQPRTTDPADKKKTLPQAVDDKDIAFVHLAELWDYLA